MDNNTYEQMKKEALDIINQQKICLENFILEVHDELTITCNIPVKIPDKNLINIIKRAKKWFYKNYEYAVETGYFYVPTAAFSTTQFNTDRSIVLPESIFSVFNIHKVNYEQMDEPFDFVNYSNQYITYGVKNTFEDLMGYVIGEKYNTDRESYLVKKFTGFQYNDLTRKLILTGEIPDTDLVLEVYKTVPDCALFQDELFFRYVVAMAQKNIAMVLGIFAYNLPGNITINFDMIQSAGQEAIDQIKEEIKEQEGTDYFFVM